MNIFETFKVLDSELAQTTGRDLYICGGAAMIALGAWQRVTMDVDAVLPKIDKILEEAASRTAKKLGLPDQWLNNGPDSLVHDLTPGWEGRCKEIFRGLNLTVHALGRMDMLKTKLWATCDRMEDIDDVIWIKPTDTELLEAKSWVLERDASEIWPQIVEETLKIIKKKMI